MVCVVNVVLVIMLFQIHDQTANDKLQFRRNITDIAYKMEVSRSNPNFFLTFKTVTEALLELEIIIQQFYRNDIDQLEKDLKLPPGSILHMLDDLKLRQQENFGYIETLQNDKDFTYPDYMRKLLGIESPYEDGNEERFAETTEK